MSGELTKLTLQQELFLKVVNEGKSLQTMLTERDKKNSLLQERIGKLEQYTQREYLVITGLKTRHRMYARATANADLTADTQEKTAGATGRLFSSESRHKHSKRGNIYLSRRKSEQSGATIRV